MFKIGMALVAGAIAALAVGLAGLATEARFSTIFFRGLAGFIVAGLVSYLAAVILELKGWVGFDENIELPPETETRAEENGEQEAEQEGEIPPEAGTEAGGEQFTPFSADNLKRVEPPPAP